MHVGTLPSGPGSSDEGVVTAKPTQFFFAGGPLPDGNSFLSGGNHPAEPAAAVETSCGGREGHAVA